MAVLLSDPEIKENHPRGWRPDFEPYLEIDRELEQGLGSIAVVGSFDSSNKILMYSDGQQTAERLHDERIIGMNRVVGIRIITSHGSRPHGRELAEKARLRDTVEGLRAGIHSLTAEEENRPAAFTNTFMHVSGHAPLNFELFDNPVLDRYQVDSAIWQAWEDFEKSVQESEHSGSDPEDRSLIVVASPKMGPILGENIKEDHLEYGGVISLEGSATGSLWRPNRKSILDEDWTDTRDRIVRSRSLSPLFPDDRAYIRRLTDDVGELLRKRGR